MNICYSIILSDNLHFYFMAGSIALTTTVTYHKFEYLCVLVHALKVILGFHSPHLLETPFTGHWSFCKCSELRNRGY